MVVYCGCWERRVLVCFRHMVSIMYPPTQEDDGESTNFPQPATFPLLFNQNGLHLGAARFSSSI